MNMYSNPRLKHVKKIKSLLVGMDGVGKEHIFPKILDQCNLLLETKKNKGYMCVRCEQVFAKHSQLGLHLDKQGNVCYKGSKEETKKAKKKPQNSGGVKSGKNKTATARQSEFIKAENVFYKLYKSTYKQPDSEHVCEDCQRPLGQVHWSGCKYRDGVSIVKLEQCQPGCTLEPYCKCEDCRNYEGDLPIDRV